MAFVRLSESVESINLTTASSLKQSSYQSSTPRNTRFILPIEDEGKVWKGDLVATPHHLNAEQVSEGIPPTRGLLVPRLRAVLRKKTHGGD